MKNFLTSLGFLTRFPSPRLGEPAPGDHGRATGFYPLVGLVAGLSLTLFSFLSSQDPSGRHHGIWMFAQLLFWVWACGSLHLDGLADTTDALASRKSGSEFLGVLHDSRVGAFGAMAMGLALTGMFLWLGLVPAKGAWYMALPLVVSRLHSALACQMRPYAGSPGSLSGRFIEESGPGDALAAWGWAAAGFAALAGAGLALGLATPWDACKALGVCAAGLGLGRQLLSLPMSRLGGISGDLIGWSQVIVELSVAFGLILALVS